MMFTFYELSNFKFVDERTRQECRHYNDVYILYLVWDRLYSLCVNLSNFNFNYLFQK